MIGEPSKPVIGKPASSAKSATSGKAGGLWKVERPKAA
jgi:hypothetical protein